jgi:hypothetical protein
VASPAAGNLGKKEKIMKETLKKLSAGLLTPGVIGGKELTKKLSAGLLALAVVGGVGGLLTMSLASTQPMSLVSTQPMPLVSTQPMPAVEVAMVRPNTPVIEPTIETVVVYGTRPANYASLVAHRKHRGAAGVLYAAARHERLGTITLQ